MSINEVETSIENLRRGWLLPFCLDFILANPKNEVLVKGHRDESKRVERVVDSTREVSIEQPEKPFALGEVFGRCIEDEIRNSFLCEVDP